MTAAQRIALAVAFERLQARMSAPAAMPQHPVIESRKAHQVVTTSRRGPYRRRTVNIAE